jgi:predicted metalloendopeptidase
MFVSHSIKPFASCLIVISILACSKKEPESTVDPLPLPQEIEKNKDLTVKPGDSFFDYCNGTWLQLNPIPASGSIGGLYALQPVMEERVKQLRASVPDIGHYYDLMEHMHEQPEKSQAYIDAQKARFPKPTTKEEAFLTMGRMLADGVAYGESAAMPMFDLVWKDRKLMGQIIPPLVLPDLSALSDYTNPEDLIPAIQTKADEQSAHALVVKGMGLDLSQFVTSAETKLLWAELEELSLDELCEMLDEAWDTYEMYVSQEQMQKHKKEKQAVLLEARGYLSYTLSYHFAEKFIAPSTKEHLVSITKEIQQSLRKRIERVDWLSETTKNNAIDKMDHYELCVAYPDEWHLDCVSSLTACETLVEAVHINKRNVARLKAELLGGRDLFSSQIIQMLVDSNKNLIPCDLTLANAMYDPSYNCVFIYPALMMPPFLPEGVSDAYSYAVFSIIGHEFTHGFDTNGAKYDKDGNKHNWWTVADQMAFEERRKNIIQCYNHLELDPERAPGVYGDGERTQTENIADLGGFLAALDAYKARLEKEGYIGKLYDNQLRKFYECYAHAWCIQYDDAKFDILRKSDVHSHARLRVNGVVMNTDLWYKLYDVDRNNILYLPPERRTYIW